MSDFVHRWAEAGRARGCETSPEELPHAPWFVRELVESAYGDSALVECVRKPRGSTWQGMTNDLAVRIRGLGRESGGRFAVMLPLAWLCEAEVRGHRTRARWDATRWLREESRVDHAIDLSGCYLPGWGEEACLVMGAQGDPGDSPVIVTQCRSVEWATPELAAAGRTWAAVRAHWDRPGTISEHHATLSVSRGEWPRVLVAQRAERRRLADEYCAEQSRKEAARSELLRARRAAAKAAEAAADAQPEWKKGSIEFSGPAIRESLP